MGRRKDKLVIAVNRLEKQTARLLWHKSRINYTKNNGSGAKPTDALWFVIAGYINKIDLTRVIGAQRQHGLVEMDKWGTRRRGRRIETEIRSDVVFAHVYLEKVSPRKINGVSLFSDAFGLYRSRRNSESRLSGAKEIVCDVVKEKRMLQREEGGWITATTPISYRHSNRFLLTKP